MRVIGVDPGFNATGYGVVDYSPKAIKLLEAGTIEPSPKDLMENRLNRIYGLLIQIIDEYDPQILVLEKIYSHHKHPLTVSKLGHVRGVICLICAQKNICLVEHSVKRIRKAITGNGNATKVQTRQVVAYNFNVDANQLKLDASDALALALGYIYMNKR